MSGKIIKFAAAQPKFDLIEMDEATLAQILSSPAVIKSSNFDTSAVLCTANQTYRIKLSETSNNLMVIDNKPD